MNTNQVTMDTVPLNKFHLKLFAYCAGCPLVDGYVLGSVAISLSIMSTQIPMSPIMSGLIGTGSLLGMFFGGMFGGYITDLIGRKKMYVLDFALLSILGVLQFFISDPMQSFIIRILLGVGLGATFPIAGPYLSEFSPQKNRGTFVGALNAVWFIGYALSYVVCYLLLPVGVNNWRWMLVSGAVPSLLWLIFIFAMPESPRWLVSKGREEEANKILKQIGDNVVLPEEQEPEEKTAFLDIFRNGYGKWVFFAAAFWTLQIVPVFGLGTYLPTIMEKFGFAQENLQYLGSAIINCLYLIGLIPIFLYMDTAGRRPTLIWSFLICTAALLILGLISGRNMPFGVILILFVLFGASNTAGGAHQWVYPNELFPTHIRATAVGFITGVTRVLSAISTFFAPIVLSNFGLTATLYICAAVSAAGLLLSIVMAPETKNMNLTKAASLNKSI